MMRLKAEMFVLYIKLLCRLYIIHFAYLLHGNRAYFLLTHKSNCGNNNVPNDLIISSLIGTVMKGKTNIPVINNKMHTEGESPLFVEWLILAMK